MPNTVLLPHHFPLYSVHEGIYSRAEAVPVARATDTFMAADIVARLNRDFSTFGPKLPDPAHSEDSDAE